MRRLNCGAIALLAPLGLFAATAEAKSPGGGSQAYDADASLAACRAAYATYATARGTQSKQLAFMQKRLYEPGREEIPALNGCGSAREIAAFSTWANAQTFLSQNAIYRSTAERAEAAIQSIDAALARLPQAVTGGFRVGSLWANPLLRDLHDKDNYYPGVNRDAQLVQRLRAIYTALKSRHPEVKAAKEAVEQLERPLLEHLDARALADLPELRARIETLAKRQPQRLLEHAVSLVQQLGDVSHEKNIRKELVGSSSSSLALDSSSAFQSGSSGETVIHRGPLGGGGRSTHESHASGRSRTAMRHASSSKQLALLLHAATYRVWVKNMFGGYTDADNFTPAETHRLATTVLEIAEATRALQLYAPHMSGALSAWLEHSNLELIIPIGTRKSETYRIDFGHVMRDVAGLAGYGIIGAGLESALLDTARQSVQRGLGQKSALFDL